MVVCNLLNTQIALPLDTEPIGAGENEVAAAKRLVERLCDHYTRFFDVIVTDAFTIDVPLRVLHTIETYTEKVEENGRVVE